MSNYLIILIAVGLFVFCCGCTMKDVPGTSTPALSSMRAVAKERNAAKDSG